MKPRVLLFDLGGVVLRIDLDHSFRRWAELAGVSAAQLRARFSMDAPYQRHERGELDDAAYFEHLRTALGVTLSDGQMLDGWNALFAGEVPGVRELLAEVSVNRPTFALSNTNPAHVRYFRQTYADVLSPFREVFASSDLGARKPERKAFEIVAAKIGARFEEILFFDDSVENVASAQALGLQAVHVRSIDDIRTAIDVLNLR